MKGLILIAHGSRVPTSNAEIEEFTRKMARSLESDYAHVGHAFLELAYPSIPVAIRLCEEKGLNRIEFFPYFLAAGKHITKDIPLIIRETMLLYPTIEYEIKPYLGAIPDLSSTIAKSLSDN